MDVAAKHARLILSCYGSKHPDDPASYTRMISASVSQCPPDLLWKLVDEVTKRHPSFLPSKGEVDAVVNDLVRPRGTARQIAKAHLAAHGRSASAEDEAKRRAEWLARQSPETLDRIEQIRAARMAGESVMSLIGRWGEIKQIPLFPDERRGCDEKSSIRAERGGEHDCQ